MREPSGLAVTDTSDKTAKPQSTDWDQTVSCLAIAQRTRTRRLTRSANGLLVSRDVQLPCLVKIALE